MFIVIGDWPSGKATGSGPVIGVRIACGNSQGNLHLKTCFHSRSFGVVKGDSNPYKQSFEP